MRGGVNSPEKSAIIDDTPYPIEIMRQAVGEVMGKTRSGAPEITPTHRYIEFVPATFEEYYRLLGSEEIDCAPASTLEEVEVPEGDNYTTPIRDGSEEPEKLYALVESDVTLPDGIAYNVLEELYTPYAAGVDSESARQVTAFAGSLLDPGDPTGSVTIDVQCTPHGRVRMIDYQDMFSQIVSVANATVRITEKVPVSLQGGEIITYYTRTETVKTDAEGYFTSGKTYSWANMKIAIVWEAGAVTITDPTGNVGVTTGVCGFDGKWEVNLSDINNAEDSMPFNYATLFRAVNVAYTGGTDVLQTYGNYIQFRAYESTSSSSYSEFRPSGAMGYYPFAKIWCGKGENVKSHEIMDRAWYELGRITKYARFHNYMTTPLPLQMEYILQSWGAFVSYYFRDKEAKRNGSVRALWETIEWNGKMMRKPDDYNMQNWRCEKPVDTKTPLFIDLYDDFNQQQYYFDIRSSIGVVKDEKRPNDNICIPDFETIYDMFIRAGMIDVIVSDHLRWLGNQYGYTFDDIRNFFNAQAYGQYLWDKNIENSLK